MKKSTLKLSKYSQRNASLVKCREHLFGRCLWNNCKQLLFNSKLKWIELNSSYHIDKMWYTNAAQYSWLFQKNVSNASLLSSWKNYILVITEVYSKIVSLWHMNVFMHDVQKKLNLKKPSKISKSRKIHVFPEYLVT